MTADAILVTGDSKRVLELQRPQQENGNIACNGLSPDDKHNSHAHKDQLPTKGKAWSRWTANLLGDTIFAAWSEKTFKIPKKGIDYQAIDEHESGMPLDK
ncbi:hypothetical protein N7455_003554 [Penicillium solitum]|uniref:Uncharacterized protein n=1 Tax=Penicillium solitum TaxID=60172 RepID=A0A1V6QST5_9EURO|nr:uncharacterized protein PENSOL_c045G10717 [Penicillium solitum]KAF4762389.1 hypothetical protein HAV15_005143 [Penicillium sp. str. \